MKLYNIQDTEKFFDRLAKCEGDVDIVATSYTDGKIDEIELYFKNPEDSVKMVEYVA